MLYVLKKIANNILVFFNMQLSIFNAKIVLDHIRQIIPLLEIETNLS